MHVTSLMEETNGKVLNGWKEIASYLRRGLRTVQRWEELYELPIRRPAGKDRASVFALTEELDKWLSESWRHERVSDPEILRVRLEQIEREKARIYSVLQLAQKESGGRKKTVLAVDDNEAFRYAVTKIVSKGGHVPLSAENGTQAIELAKAEQPAVILLDVNMPDLNGYEVCRRLKSDPATARIPVIFLSATEKNTAAIEKGIAAGAETFLFSPIDSDQLLAVLHGAIVKHGAGADTRVV